MESGNTSTKSSSGMPRGFRDSEALPAVPLSVRVCLGSPILGGFLEGAWGGAWVYLGVSEYAILKEVLLAGGDRGHGKVGQSGGGEGGEGGEGGKDGVVGPGGKVKGKDEGKKLPG